VHNLLVVDHDYATRLMMANGLRTIRCDVTDAETGTEAAWLLEHRKFDLTIIDLLVPGVPARQVVQHALERRIPVLLTSDDHDMLARFDRLGLPWLAKPFRLADLLHKARQLLHDIELHLQRCRRGMARLSVSADVDASSEETRKLVLRARCERERRLRRQDVMALRELAESYRGMARGCAGAAREGRLRLAAQLESQASRHEWLMELEALPVPPGRLRSRDCRTKRRSGRLPSQDMRQGPSISPERTMKDKSKQTTQHGRQAEPNLGQKEARLDKKSRSELSHMDKPESREMASKPSEKHTRD
jgi:DNA-binding response OmpR family regulator